MSNPKQALLDKENNRLKQFEIQLEQNIKTVERLQVERPGLEKKIADQKELLEGLTKGFNLKPTPEATSTSKSTQAVIAPPPPKQD